MNNPVYHITPFTLLDYPDKTACIVWFAGCNMRCKYCYNIEIVKGKGKFGYSEVYRFLDTRINLLDGVVLSGGECTMHHGIETLIGEIKKRNMLVKIDTNGSNPRILQKLIQGGLIDYVALDFKALAESFYFVTQSDLFTKFEKSLDLLLTAKVPFELRTTYHSELLNQNDLNKMLRYLEKKSYRGVYYIQNFMNQVKTLGNIKNNHAPLAPGILHSNSFEIAIRNQ